MTDGTVAPLNATFPGHAHAAAALVPDVRKIAVLRANALGDFIFVLPALEALRAAYPGAEIVLVARDWHQAFLDGRPGPIDRVFPLPHGALGDETDAVRDFDPDAREALFRSLEAECFDLALQMHGGGRNSNPFLLRFRARVTAGCRTPDAPHLDRSIPYIYLQSEVARLREVAALVGATDGPIEPRLEVMERDLAEAEEVAPSTGRPLAVLHPGASDPRRRWAAERFAAAGDALYEAGADVFVTGTDPEEALVESVITTMKTPARALVGRLSIAGLAGLLSRSAIVVSNDTGPLHVAGAVGTPTVGIYWIGNMINSGPVTRARRRALTSWRVDCPVCGADCIRQGCDHRESFVTDVPTEAVVQSAVELLAGGSVTTAERRGDPTDYRIHHVF